MFPQQRTNISPQWPNFPRSSVNKDKCKLNFDHTKINDRNDVEHYKNEVLPYLKNDLLALEELTKIFNHELYVTTGFNLTQSYTAPGITYKINKKSIAEYNKNIDNEDKLLIEKPYHEKDDFIRREIYGWRCLSGKK